MGLKDNLLHFKPLFLIHFNKGSVHHCISPAAHQRKRSLGITGCRAADFRFLNGIASSLATACAGRDHILSMTSVPQESRADKAAGIVLRGCLDHLGAIALFDQLPTFHNHDPVGHGPHHRQIVADEKVTQSMLVL